MEGHPSLGDRLAEFFALHEEMNELAEPTRALFVHETIGHAAPSGGAGRRIGDYELLEEIARGGMGIVYRARQRSLNRLVAVKMLQDGPWLVAADAARFRNEAEAIAQLDHPHIVPVYEVGEECGRIYFSMKLIEGRSLAERLAEYGVDPGKAARTMAAVARAVQHAHERGILHRDLKPSNILIDDRGQPLVADFGLASRVDGTVELTQTGVLVGTPSYMAPEQASGQKGAVTTATDIQGLGGVLYAILAGRPPFRGDSPLAILEQVREQIPEPPSTIRRTIDRDLETICLKCLEKDPKRRYASAAEVAEDLERRADGRPIRARPMSCAEYAWRRCLRDRRITALTAMAIVLLALTLAGIVASRQAHRDVERLAEEARRSGRALRREEYARDVKQARQAWEDNHLDRARQLLERHRPAAGEEDTRGFAWHYLHRLCRGGPPPLRAHQGEVYFATFSPDGKILATAGGDRLARLWDPESGRARMSLVGHAHDVNWIAIAPDGRTAATASEDQTVKLWDLATGRDRATLSGHGDEVVAAIFSPDGRRLISCGRKGKVIIRDADTLVERDRFDVDNPDLQAMAISPDGKALAIAGHGTIIRSLETGREVARLERRSGQARWAEFSHDGQSLVTSGRGEELELWETRTWKQTATFRTGDGELFAARFAPDDRTLAAAGSHGRIHLIDRRSGLRESISSGQGSLWCVTYSPDGQSLAASSRDGTVMLRDLRRDRSRIAVSVPTASIASFEFSADGGAITVADNQGRVWSCDARTGALAAARPIVADGRIRRAVVANHCRWLVTIAEGPSRLTLWELSSGTRLADYAFPAGMNHYDLTVSADGRWIASPILKDEVFIQDSGPGRASKILDGPEGTSVILSPRGDTVSAWGWGTDLPTLWDTASGHPRSANGSGHRTTIIAQAFSADGTRLATGANSGSIILWDTESVRPVVQIPGPATHVRSIAFSPDGRTLATGHEDGRVWLWDVATARELLPLDGHSRPVQRVGFSPDGLTIATCSDAPEGRSDLVIWPATTRE